MSVDEPRLTPSSIRLLVEFLREPSRDRYGFELSEVTGIGPGTLYPALRRLVDAGWLQTTWERINPTTEGRPRRRFYRLTPEGCLAAPDRIEASTGMRPSVGLGKPIGEVAP